MRAHIGISFSHPKEAQVAEQLSARAWRKDALLFQRMQQRLYGSQVLWDCSPDALHINTSILTPTQTCYSLDNTIAAECIAVCSDDYGALKSNKMTCV